MPLHGIRVLEWGVFMQGPLACEMLGAFGADVIKIEDPRKGDPARGAVWQAGVSQALPDGRTAIFETHNRNKRDIAVDLKKKAGIELIYRLVEKSDVFVHNHTKDVTERLGLDYQTLYALNPKLVYAQGSGLGANGPESTLPATDSIAQARSGILLHGTYRSDSLEATPSDPILAAADDVGALSLTLGIVMALMGRERLGIGQKVDCSILGGALRIIRQRVAGYYLTGHLMPEAHRETAPNPIYNHYRCGDGRWLRLAINEAERYWPTVCSILDVAGLVDDPRFVDVDRRQQNCRELISLFDEAFARRSYGEWEQRFKAANLLHFGPVRAIPDLIDDPQVTANRYLVDFVDPLVGPVKVPGMPFDLSATPWSIRTTAPQIGEHTEEVLTQVLGYTGEQIGRLRREEVIR